jgi:hypothetical protein
MRGPARWIRRSLGVLAALGCAGAVGAVASSSPAVPRWTADPEEQFLLDVSLRQLRLGDGVRAYATPEGTCVLLGDLLAALDVPMRIDLGARKASGWAFQESNRIAIDLAAGTVQHHGRSEPLAPGAVHETGDGWCVDTAAFSRWFGVSAKPLTSGSALVIESEAKLPVELAVEREKRAKHLKKNAKFDLATLPQVRLPYRLWRAPALDFVVSGGVTYSAQTGTRVDRRTSIHAAGELAHLSYDAQLATNDKGAPSTLRFRAYRSDPDGGLLGPLRATHAAAGDVSGLDSRLVAAGSNGRGLMVTNRPLLNPTDFDRTRFEGDLPAGWEAELYRNGELVAFARPTATGRYAFEDVQLFYGENRIQILLYGPQGQIRTRDELINVGRDNVPPGKTWYWAGVNQPGRDLVELHRSPDALKQPKMQAAVALEHGLDKRTSVGVLARAMLLEDERVTFLEGSVRRSVGPALVELGAARDSGGGTALRAQAVGRIGSVNLSAEALVAEDFHLDGRGRTSRKDLRFAVDAPLRLGRTSVPVHADVRMLELADGSRQLEAAARLAATVERFNLATDVRFRRQFLAHGPSPPGALDVSLLAAGRVGAVRVRGSAIAEVTPVARLRSAELSAYWSASDTADWEGAVAYDASERRGRARVSHIRRFNGLALSLTGEAATDGSLALGVNANFSLDWSRGINFSRQPLAGAGSIRANVFRDLNDNGRRDAGEPAEKGALITAGTRVIEKPTDSAGSVMAGGFNTFAPIAIGVDSSTLSDPMLVPRKALQVVVPRPGVPAEVDIALVGGGSVEGALVKSGGIGFEGVDLELVDAAGKVVATTQTDFDGFFLFERVPYGAYRLRAAAGAAAAAGIAGDLAAAAIDVSPERSIVRLGAIAAVSASEIAAR